MTDLYIWLTIIGVALITVLTRASFLLLGDRVSLPERVQHGLRYAPVCALVALITPELFLSQGTLDFSISNAKLIAGAAAAAIMLVTRSMIATIVIGMLAFTTIRLLG
ncbi:MAG: AzlD domain-containing protein [Burkholderiaceae bacterium]